MTKPRARFYEISPGIFSPLNAGEKGPSELATPVTAGPVPVVAAVATGSSPGWNRELSALADEWDKHAWSLKEDEVRLRGEKSPLAEQFYARWAVHRNCAEDLRRKLASLNKRQPESNIKLSHD